jgi:hypothetical protein
MFFEVDVGNGLPYHTLMKTKFPLLICSCLVLLLPRAGAGEFKPIFDGKTLAGWTAMPGGTWEVKDGIIVGKSPATEPKHGILLTDKSYKDFTVRCKFRVHAGDSGFYFRAEKVDNAVSVNGFQVEVDSSQETGGLYETGGRAWVVQPTEAEIPRKHYKPGEWTTLELTAKGADVTVKINGVVTAALKNDPGRKEGYIGLQLHGGMEMNVEFKEIEIQEE